MGRVQKTKCCCFCKHQFSSPNKLKKHLDSKVCTLNKPIYKCTHCDKKYLNKKCYEKHKHKHVLKVTKFTCRTCLESFQNRSLLYAHIIFKHRDDKKSYTCRKCSHTFDNRRDFFKHHTKFHLLAGRQLQSVPKDIANAQWTFTSPDQQQKLDEIEQTQGQQSSRQQSVQSTSHQQKQSVADEPRSNQQKQSVADESISSQQKQSVADESLSRQRLQSVKGRYDQPQFGVQPQPVPPEQPTPPIDIPTQFNVEGLKETYDLHAPFILQKHQIGNVYYIIYYKL